MDEPRAKHGSHRRYAVHGCRCDVCREAFNRRMREQRERATERAAEWISKAKVDQRRRHLKRNYDLTPEQYETMVEACGGVCEICERPPNTKRLFVDHDHVTGKVRGLLCARCNTLLGWLEAVGPHLIVGWINDHRESADNLESVT